MTCQDPARHASVYDPHHRCGEEHTMKFRMEDGTEFTGRSFSDIVRRMMDEKLTEPQSTESYRRATAQRVSELYSVMIDATDDRLFIESLVAAKIVERVS